MTLFEMVNEVFTRGADVGEYAHFGVMARNQKAMRVTGIVQLGESRDAEIANPNGFIAAQRTQRKSFRR